VRKRGFEPAQPVVFPIFMVKVNPLKIKDFGGLAIISFRNGVIA
jgi:hypothetical protein